MRDLIAAAQADPPACLTSSHTSTTPGAPGWSTWAARRRPTGARWRAPTVRMSAETAARGGARRRAQGRRDRHRAHRRHPGRQAHRRAGPALPPAAAVVRGRRGRGGRDRVVLTAEARTTGPDRRGDGGDDRGRRGRADRLRHGQGLERGVEIAEVVLLEKTGGKSDWRRR